MPRPFSKKKYNGKYQNLVDEVCISSSQIIHYDFDVQILGTDVVYHLNNVLLHSFVCLCQYYFYGL